MNDYIAQNKIPCIKIYYLEKVGSETIKHYIHPAGTLINAEVRQIKADNAIIADSERSDSLISAVVNFRNKINENQYIEFKGRTYQIVARDDLEFKSTELKLTAKLIKEKFYSGTDYDAWD